MTKCWLAAHKRPILTPSKTETIVAGDGSEGKEIIARGGNEKRVKLRKGAGLGGDKGGIIRFWTTSDAFMLIYS